MGLIRNLILGGVAAVAMAMPVVAAEKAIIILDASGSMWAQVDGKARITIARETLAKVLQGVPDDLELGFMAYGHREKGDCNDIEMMVEPAAGTAAAILKAADSITPKGKTPLSAAVRMAAEDLKYTEEKATVILITDGLETCNVDPCALGADLENKGVDFTVDVVGFGLTEEEGKQVSCLADNTGGQYFSAQDGDSLVKALTQTVAETVAPATPEPKPEPVTPPAVDEFNLIPTATLSEGGPDIVDDKVDLRWDIYKAKADGTQGEFVDTSYGSTYKTKLDAGDYLISAGEGSALVTMPVTIKAGKVAKPHFVINGAILLVHPRPSEGADVDKDATVNIVWPADNSTFYGDVRTVVPAGEITLNVSIGAAKVSETFTATAGDTIDKDVIVGSGIGGFASEYVEGQAVTDDIYLEVFEAKKALDGTRKSVTYGYGGSQQFDLPQGDYVVDYTLDGTKGEVPFTIKTGERTDVTLVLDAGVVAITTPKDDYVEIIGAKKDIKGNSVSYDYGYGPTFETTLKAGDYIIKSLDKETPLTVPAGERTEITLK